MNEQFFRELYREVLKFKQDHPGVLEEKTAERKRRRNDRAGQAKSERA